MAETSVRLTLVSASPRRRELIAKLGFEFDVCPSPAHEHWHGESSAELASRNAERKILASEHFLSTDRVLIGADTIIAIDCDVLGKPVGIDSARRMLARLSNREHKVFTGLCVSGPDSLSQNQVVKSYAESSVTFGVLDQKDIATYLRSKEWVGKAGAYAVQGLAGAFVTNLSGDVDNVIGLPLSSLRELLRRHFSHCSFR